MPRLHVPQDVETAAVGHVDVEDQHVAALALQAGQDFVPRNRFVDFGCRQRVHEELAQSGAEQRVVVGDQYASHRSASPVTLRPPAGHTD